jgi:5-methylcytosine-specific restriction endonuclease McrA
MFRMMATRSKGAIYTAQYRARHYERYRARENELRRSAEFRAAQRQKRAENKDLYRERDRQKRLRNPEADKERQRRWRERNREKFRAANRGYSAKRRMTPQGRLENVVRVAMHAEITRGSKRGRKTFDLLGYSSAELVAHLERQFTKGMSWSNYGSEWHIDHIVPLSSFSYETPDDPDFKSAWALTNLRPLWATENFSKGAKVSLLI